MEAVFSEAIRLYQVLLCEAAQTRQAVSSTAMSPRLTLRIQDAILLHQAVFSGAIHLHQVLLYKSAPTRQDLSSSAEDPRLILLLNNGMHLC
jgi:hypothetical protein